ncbi:hypothetical protein SteCoe_33273 [Stentor coeruleus]|uniref:Uncharacterized protein n=1 Tax=Stentor coeruleus TaxID=5963 RepID=A0A1R2AX56_9CILI|nr:hypothetical protein SteCoe_33273 [Stentor coeruleus]
MKEIIKKDRLGKASKKSGKKKGDCIEDRQKEYLGMRTKYLSQGLTQNCLMIGRRISVHPGIPDKLKSINLLERVLAVISEFIMNDLEAVLFAQYLESFAWNDKDFSIDTLLSLTALSVKNSLSEKFSVFHEHLFQSLPSFSSSYKRFLRKYSKNFSFDIKTLNSKLSAYTSQEFYSSPNKIVDYNFYVDEILKSSLAYNIDIEPKNDKKNKSNMKNLSKKDKKNIKDKEKPVNQQIGFPLPTGEIYNPALTLARDDSQVTDMMWLSRQGSVQETGKKITTPRGFGNFFMHEDPREQVKILASRSSSAQAGFS